MSCGSQNNNNCCPPNCPPPCCPPACCPPVIIKTRPQKQQGQCAVFQLPPVNIVCEIPPPPENQNPPKVCCIPVVCCEDDGDFSGCQPQCPPSGCQPLCAPTGCHPRCPTPACCAPLNFCFPVPNNGRQCSNRCE